MITVRKEKLKLTKEQYDRLNTDELKWFLKTAHYSNFITGLTMKQANELFTIYNEVFREKKRATSCSQCRLDVCMRLGKLFFEYENEQINELNNEPIDDPIDDPIKEECNMSEEELEKYADEINEAIIKDINESHAQKTNDSKATKTNNTKKKEKK